MNKGKFIVLEGPDGAGKGEQIKRLSYDIFEVSKKNNVLLTREPTYFSKAGIEVRRRLKEEKDAKAHAKEFTWLYVDDREEHQKIQIIPALEYGAHVISDRFDLSTYAYQQTQGMSKEEIHKMHKERRIIIPDLTIIIDISAKTSLERIAKGRGCTEKFEQLDFLKELRQNYLGLVDYFAKVEPGRKIVVVNGEPSIDEVYKEIKKAVSEIIPL